MMANKLLRRLDRILLEQNIGRRRASQTYSDRIILMIFLWSVINDRPRSWACELQNAPDEWPFVQLPDASSVSRRVRTDAIVGLLKQLVRVLNDSPAERFWYTIDAKPLPVSESTKDPEARVGRGAGTMQKGDKLYTIIDDQHHVVDLRVAPLNGDEKTQAFRMLRERPDHAPVGDLLGDAVYDSSRLYDWAAHQGFRLIAPRAKPGTGLGHCYQSPLRKRAIEIMESPDTGFAEGLRKMRDDIERSFGQLCRFAAGLAPWPAWVRRLHRVRAWVQAKVIIHSLTLHHM